ncbi:hypothetical protein MMC10_003656 [Thelotrema lepadinum]|nr:hypothetical protein [Thelotrema lepadinum]
MGSNNSKPDRSSTSSTTPFAATTTPAPSALLEKNYAAYYSSDTYTNISAAAATSYTPNQPPFDPTAAQLSSTTHPVPKIGITPPAPRPDLWRVSELIDPNDLVPQSRHHSADVHDPRRTGVTPDTSPQKRRPLLEADKNKRLPTLVQSPSGNVFGAAEFAAHPKRPLAMRERQEGIKAALARAQADVGMVNRGEHPAPMVPGKDYEARAGGGGVKGVRKGSGGSTGSAGSGGTVDSGVSFGSGYGDSYGRNANVGEWEAAKIEEGRRRYEERQMKANRGEKDGEGKKGKKGGFLCFK